MVGIRMDDSPTRIYVATQSVGAWLRVLLVLSFFSVAGAVGIALYGGVPGAISLALILGVTEAVRFGIRLVSAAARGSAPCEPEPADLFKRLERAGVFITGGVLVIGSILPRSAPYDDTARWGLIVLGSVFAASSIRAWWREIG